MKKSIFAIIFTIASLFAVAQPTLYFKITTEVITTDGRSISSNAVVSFSTHPEAISDSKMPCDLNWWISEAAQDSGYAKIMPTTSLSGGTVLNVAYLQVTVPAQQFSYTVFQDWAKAWLQAIYGNNVTILN